MKKDLSYFQYYIERITRYYNWRVCTDGLLYIGTEGAAIDISKALSQRNIEHSVSEDSQRVSLFVPL